MKIKIGKITRRPRSGTRGMTKSQLEALVNACRSTLSRSSGGRWAKVIAHKYFEKLDQPYDEEMIDFIRSQFNKLVKNYSNNPEWYNMYPQRCYLPHPDYIIGNWTYITSCFYLLEALYSKFPLLEEINHLESSHANVPEKNQCAICSALTVVHNLTCGLVMDYKYLPVITLFKMEVR